MTTNHRDPKDHQHKSEQLHSATKVCVQCGAAKPLTEFLRRTGRRSGKFGRRGACRSCRQKEAPVSVSAQAGREAAQAGGKTLQAERWTGRASLEATQGSQGSAESRPVEPNSQRPANQPPPREAGEAVLDEAVGRGKPPKAQPKVSADAKPQIQTEGNAAGISAATSSTSNDVSGSANSGITPGAGRSRKRRRGNKRVKGAQQRQAARPAAEAPPPHTPRRDKHDPADASFLRPTAKGFIRMRGKTDNGRRWYQEVDPELAQVLVREGAAVVVNRSTIRRLFSSREFRKLILTRDDYTCHFCGKYGDTIDHKLPRAKGGHTTPVNCVCACYECNQLKASRDIDEFVNAMDEYMR